MATLSVTNGSSSDVYISDLYTSVPAGKTISTERKATDLPRMATLQAAIAAGTVTISVAYSAAEKASGLVDEGDTAATENAGGLADMLVVRKLLVAGAGGSADDVTIYALNSLPFKKMRVLDAYLILSAGSAGGRKVSVRTATAAAGTLLAETNATAAGRNGQTSAVTATSVITNGATVGLFARRSDSAIAGEIVVTLRPEV